MDNTVRASLLFISFVLATYCLYVTRDILAPFALAIFFWLVIDAFARWIDGRSARIPYPLALTIAIIFVLLGVAGVILIIGNTVGDIAGNASYYQTRLVEIFSWADGILATIGPAIGQPDLSFQSLNQEYGLVQKLQSGILGFGASIQSVLSNFLVITIYIAFLFAAQSSFPKKMDDLFPNEERRMRAQFTTKRIRTAVEKYVGVQTLMSLIQTVLSYVVMAACGLDNALFWALVIFILNYIPIVGGIMAVILPITFAFIQFTSLTRIGVLAGGLFLAQFIINNTLQPKMMGDSMNMSALVVILSLTLWGALWGGVGMFLSAPLTVIIMIILAQFPTTRWIAVLLSADGHPDMDDDPKPEPTPSM